MQNTLVNINFEILIYCKLFFFVDNNKKHKIKKTMMKPIQISTIKVKKVYETINILNNIYYI